MGVLSQHSLSYRLCYIHLLSGLYLTSQADVTKSSTTVTGQVKYFSLCEVRTPIAHLLYQGTVTWLPACQLLDHVCSPKRCHECFLNKLSPIY